MTTIIMLTEIAIGLEGLEQTSRSRTPLSIAELNLKFSLPVLQMQVGRSINKFYACMTRVSPFRASLDDVPMVHFGLESGLHQIIADLIGHHHRAVLPSGAPECDRKVALSLLNIVRQ